jgi:hypothetical protein
MSAPRPLLVLEHSSRAQAMRRTGEVKRVIGVKYGPFPSQWEGWDGVVPRLVPRGRWVGEVRQGIIAPSAFLQIYRELVRRQEPLTPGRIVPVHARRFYKTLFRLPLDPITDGDALVCCCPRPGSPKRAHPCHLEVLAPELVRAGWDVQLFDKRLTLVGDQVVDTVADLPFSEVA